MTATVYHLNYFQAIVIGLIQGLTELLPISSLGHTVLIPSWFGGTWAQLVSQESSSESPYLAFIVGLHLATAFVLLGFYAREWARLIAGLLRSIVRRRIETDSERLAWLIVIATIPVGIAGLALEHTFRVIFAKPALAAFFLMMNGIILFAGEWYRRRTQGRADGDAKAAEAAGAGSEAETAIVPRPAVVPASATGAGTRFRDEHIVAMDEDAETHLARVGVLSAFLIGISQSLALLAGISREGVAMVGGLFRGLSNENALRFAFLLSTPVILAAGALKIPDLTGTLGNGVRGQVIAGSLAAASTSLFAVVFLTRYFKTRTLTPFAVYSLAFGFVSLIRFGIF